MDTEKKNETFTYTYSATQHSEVEHIRNKYLPREMDKMEQLRRLDNSVAQKAMILALSMGILSALLLGIGMCCCMVWMDALVIPGILIGLVGLVGVCTAYPVYTRTVQKERQKIAPQILKLTEELMK